MLLYGLDKIDQIWGISGAPTKSISRLKSISSNEDNYLEEATGGVL